MAIVQRLSGTSVTSPVMLIAGASLSLKILPQAGEKLPVTLGMDHPENAAVGNINNRLAANFTSFTVSGKAAGTASLSATFTGGMKIEPLLSFIVEAPVALPSASTDVGILVRLMLAEAPTPLDVSAASANDITTAMTLMRVVVENRLNTPSSAWSSKDARTLADVVRSKNQFDGFEAYPTLSARVEARLTRLLARANDPSDTGHATLTAHINSAIAIATARSPADPTNGKMYWWRTAGSGAPASGVVAYKTLVGNTFYRLK